MAIWKLEPTNLDSSDWDLSTYRDTVIARADSAEAARNLACGAFAVGADTRTQHQSTRLGPWHQEELVSCTLVDDTGYPPHGESRVLEPLTAM